MLREDDSCRPSGLSIPPSGYALLPPPLRTIKAGLIEMMLNMCLLDFGEASVDRKALVFILRHGKTSCTGF